MEDNGSLTRVAAFPIGMDPESFTRALQRQDVATNIQQLLARYAGRKVDLHTRNPRSETLDPKPKGLLPKLQSLGSSCLGMHRGFLQGARWPPTSSSCSRAMQAARYALLTSSGAEAWSFGLEVFRHAASGLGKASCVSCAPPLASLCLGARA